MEIKEAVVAALKEIIFPELQGLKHGQAELRASLEGIHKRLDDHNAYLVDLSRRVDEVRSELIGRLDKVESGLTARIKEVDSRLDRVESELTTRIDQVRSELTARLDQLYGDLIARNDETNRAIARLYEVIVRRDELGVIMDRVSRVEWEVEELKKKLAA